MPRSRFGAFYLSAKEPTVALAGSRKTLKRSFFALFCFSLVLLLVVSSFSSGFLTAWADDDGYSSDLSGAAGGSSIGSDQSQEQVIDDALNIPDTETNTWYSVIKRILTPDYINYTPQATVSSSVSSVATALGYSPTNDADATNDQSNYLCSVNAVGAGTPIYHNCDVPNFMAQALQTVFSLVDSSGAKNANPTQASGSTISVSFGLPKNIPGDGEVPVNVEDSSNKYTGLELYGYDLELTRYKGEWDNISVMTSARLLSNFSFFDSISLGTNTLLNSITGAFDRAGSLSAQWGASSGPIGFVAGFLTGLFEGGSSAALNTIFDTSDANVVLSYGWYRTNYSTTAYGVRSLTNAELAAIARAQLLDFINQSMPEDASYDAWLKATAADYSTTQYGSESAGDWIKDSPRDIAKCTIVDSDGNKTEYNPDNAKDTAPGISKDACAEAQVEAQREAWDNRYKGDFSPSTSYDSGQIVSDSGSYYIASKDVAAYIASKDVAASDATPGSQSSDWAAISCGASDSADCVYSDYKVELSSDECTGEISGGWCSNGNGKESFNQWWERKTGGDTGNGGVDSSSCGGDFEACAKSFGINDSTCIAPDNADSNESAIANAAYTSFVSCWAPLWYNAAIKNEVSNQTTDNNNWFQSILSRYYIEEYLTSNQDAFDFNSPWKRYVCLNSDGTDVVQGYYSSGSGSSSGTQEGDIGTAILTPVWDKNGSVNAACPQSEYRSPIQGALFGSGYNTSLSDQQVQNDTRYINNYGGGAASSFYNVIVENITGNFTSFFLRTGQIAVQAANEIITWTYMPILDSLGLKDLIVSITTALLNGMFLPLSVLFIALAALYILWQAGARRAYREAWTSAFYLVLVFILGALLLYKTDAVIDAVDGIPSIVEQELLGVIMDGSMDNDPICNAESNENVNTSDSMFGDFVTNLTSKKANEGLREMLCLNWKVFVFEPWSAIQWGTSSDNLWANGYAQNGGNDLNNTNEDLVGDAGVAMGNGTTVHNWALYQLSVTKLGTSTTTAISPYDQYLEKNFYRIVDLQAGPNNGEGTDSTYLCTWSGNCGARGILATISAGVGIFDLVVIFFFAFGKLIVTLMATLMLLLMPIVFLIGLLPAKRRFVTQYFLTIASLAIQRIALFIVIALMLLFISIGVQATTGYLALALVEILLLTVFFKFRKPILKFALSSGGGTGAFSAFTDGHRFVEKTMASASEKLGIGQYARRTGAALSGSAVGAVAGALHRSSFVDPETGRVRRDSLLTSMRKSAKRERDLNAKRFKRRSALEGFKGIYNISQDAQNVRRRVNLLAAAAPLDNEAKFNAYLKDKDPNAAGVDSAAVISKAFSDLKANLPHVKNYNKDKKAWDSIQVDAEAKPGQDGFEGYDEDEQKRYKIFAGKKIYKPKMPRIMADDQAISTTQYKNVRKYASLSLDREMLQDGNNKAVELLKINNIDVASLMGGDGSELSSAVAKISGLNGADKEKVTEALNTITANNSKLAEIDLAMKEIEEEFDDLHITETYYNDPELAQAKLVQDLNKDRDKGL